jgi:hypothetical protein
MSQRVYVYFRKGLYAEVTSMRLSLLGDRLHMWDNDRALEYVFI